MLYPQITQKVLDLIDDIDTRLALKLKPRKVRVPKNLFRTEAIYDRTNKKMYDFLGLSEDPPYWIVRDNIDFDYYRSPGIYVFNMGWQPYGMTMYTDKDQLGPTTCFNHIVKHSVKFV